MDALDTELFYNKRIGKRLAIGDAREVVEFMKREGRAEWIGKPGAGEEGGTAWIWWRTPEEWAGAIAEWVGFRAVWLSLRRNAHFDLGRWNGAEEYGIDLV